MKNKILALALLCLTSIGSFAQSNDVTGKVVDRWGKPISGALISIVDNPVIKVSTDKNGNFKIAAIPGNKLTIQTPAFESKTADVVDKNIKVVMDYTSQPVHLGFGINQTIGESTASISSVGSEQLMKSSALSLSNSLFGNVLGLTALQNGGTVWENYADFSIRGLKSLSSNGVLVLVEIYSIYLYYFSYNKN